MTRNRSHRKCWPALGQSEGLELPGFSWKIKVVISRFILNKLFEEFSVLRSRSSKAWELFTWLVMYKKGNHTAPVSYVRVLFKSIALWEHYIWSPKYCVLLLFKDFTVKLFNIFPTEYCWDSFDKNQFMSIWNLKCFHLQKQRIVCSTYRFCSL